MKVLGVFLFPFLLSFNSSALEVDSFTHRDRSIPDAIDLVDDFVNDKVNEAIKEANKIDHLYGRSCSYRTLRRKVKKKLVAGVRGLFISSPLQTYIDKNRIGADYLIRTKKQESIYRYIPLIYKPFLKLTPYSPLLKVDDALIGSDKFSHFFNIGYLYYRRLEHGFNTREILKYGRSSEKIMWGGFFNGIISNGDLVANFNGLRFFQHLFGKGIDPLTKEDLNSNGYIKCIDNEYQLSRRIELSHFIDDGMDEGINCSDYTSKLMRKKIVKGLNKVNATCPMEPDRCADLGRQFNEYKSYLISKSCH